MIVTHPTADAAVTAVPRRLRDGVARQRAFLLAVARLTAQRGFPPTLREVGDAIGASSTGYLAHTRDCLIRGGLLHYAPGCFRSMTLTPIGRAAIDDVRCDLRTARGAARG